MNRRAKRQKYRRMEQKYKNEIRRLVFHNAFEHAETHKREIRTISVLFTDDFSSALANSFPESQKKLAAQKLAEHLFENKDFIKEIKAGYGVIYQIDIISPMES